MMHATQIFRDDHPMQASHLIDRLPPVRGRLVADAPLGPLTWFRTGGAAEALFTPVDADDLAGLLRALPGDVPVTVIGLGSNLLVRDGGVAGVVIRLDRGFDAITVDGNEIIAGAGAPDRKVALAAQKAGLTGLEFLTGVPGLVGGALAMNAGAYGTEMVDCLVQAEAIDRAGQIHEIPAAQMGMRYRYCGAAQDGMIFTACRLKATPGNAAEIAARMADISTARADTQPVKARTGGSTFANPEGHKAWALIDQAGCRGLKVGGAQVSEKHTNFLINTGDATAADLEMLIKTVRARVEAHSGISLRTEIRIIGEKERTDG